MPDPLRFGPFVLDPATRSLTRDGAPVELQPRTWEVLWTLAERRGDAVSRAALIAAAWGGAHVVDNALTQAVRKARAALGDDPEAPEWLLSVPRFGYRLAMPPAAVPVSPGFVGRAAELAALARPRAGLRLVLGPGGIGKSRVVREALAARGAEPVRVDLASAGEPAVALAAVAAALGVPGSAIGDALGALGRPLLLEAAEGVAGWLGERLAAWRAAAPGAELLVTSRVAPEAPWDEALRLGPLAPAEAAALLDHHAGRALAGEAPEGLLRVLDGLPLAIGLLGARARFLGPADLERRLVGRLSTTGDGRADREARHGSLGASLDVTAALLDPEALRALRAVAWFEGSFGPDDADALSADAAWALPALGEAGLARYEGGRHRLPDPVREWARELPDPDRSATWARHAAWIAEKDLAPPFDEPLRDALAAAARPESEPVAVPLGTQLQRLGEHSGARVVAADAVARLAARSPALAAPLALAEAALLRPVGREAAARTEAALATAARTEDLALRAKVALVRAQYDSDGSRPQAALDGLRAAADLPMDPDAACVAALATHRALHLLGRHAEAGEVAGRALALAAEAPRLLGDAHLAAGRTARIRGELGAARAHFEAARDALEGQGARASAPYTLLGILALDEGDPAAAAGHFREALARSPRTAHVLAPGRLNLGQALRAAGRLGEAEGELAGALGAARSVGDARTEALGLLALGDLHLERGAPASAIPLLRDAVAVARPRGLLPTLVPALVSLATATVRIGDLDAAEACLAEATPHLGAAEAECAFLAEVAALELGLARGSVADPAGALRAIERRVADAGVRSLAIARALREARR